MNLIEGGRPRIGCIRRQPSAGSFILSLEEGHPSMGKIAGSTGKRGRTSGAPQLPGTLPRSRRRRPDGSTRGRDGSSRDLRGAGQTKSRNKLGSGLIRRNRGAPRRTKAATRNGPSSNAWERY